MVRHAAVLVALGCLPGIACPQAAPAADLVPRTITVSGSGEVRAAPDKATVTIRVLARAPTLADARGRVNKVVPSLLALARDLQVADADVHSSALAVNPDYQWDEKARARHLSGYHVERRLVIELKDIDRLGELLEKGVSRGANVIDEPELDSSHRKELERKALELAFADAARNADVLAASAGGRRGPSRAIAMTGTRLPDVPFVAAKVAEPSLPDVAPPPIPEATYRAGELTFTASVEATFDLLPSSAPP